MNVSGLLLAASSCFGFTDTSIHRQAVTFVKCWHECFKVEEVYNTCNITDLY